MTTRQIAASGRARARAAVAMAALLLASCSAPGGVGSGGTPAASVAPEVAAANYRRGAALIGAQATAPGNPEGVRLIRLAAEQGDGDAAFLLATTPALRIESERGEAGAVAWLRRAAIAGHPTGMYLYGEALLNGRSVPQEPAWAAMWLGRAAAAGQGRAQLMLGALYLDGTGVPVDRVQAYRWLALAQAGRTPGAERLARALASRLSPAERAAARDAGPAATAFPDEALTRFVQYALQRLGLPAGPIDGVADSPATRGAIQQFQRANGLAADGRIETALVQRLRDRLRAAA